MTVYTSTGYEGWAVFNGTYDIHPNKRKMSITIEPEDNIEAFETPDIFDWLLMDEDYHPRYDEMLTDSRQIIMVDYESWVAWPSNKVRITYEVTFDPYKLP